MTEAVGAEAELLAPEGVEVQAFNQLDKEEAKRRRLTSRPSLQTDLPQRRRRPGR